MTDYSTIRDEIDADARRAITAVKRKKCSTNSDVIALVKHAKKLRRVLKDAEKAGFCMDELLDVCKEIDND